MSLVRAISPTLQGIRKRRVHFKRKRAFAEKFEASGNETLARQLRECQETEILACCSACGKSWFVINRCRLRVCPLCSYEVAKLRGEFLVAMTKHMQHPKMITLTMPLWTAEPRRGITFLRDKFNLLRRHSLFDPVKGGAYQIELKEKDEGWHIHMHVLVDAPFIPYQHLFTEWKKILGTTAPQIRIQAASSPRAKEYVCKYAAKSSDFDTSADGIVKWYEATKGMRLFATFGKWYNATIEELDGEHADRQTVAVCPSCGGLRTVFLARDGPFLYGHEGWRDLETHYAIEGEQTRVIAGADREILEPERPEERIERLTKEREWAEKHGKLSDAGQSTFSFQSTSSGTP